MMCSRILMLAVVGVLLVNSSWAAGTAKAAAAATPAAVAAPAAAVTPAKAKCTTCADAFQAVGWNLADIDPAVLTVIVDTSTVITCFAPPPSAVDTLSAQLTQLKISAAKQKSLIADVLKYHISLGNKLAITPATIPPNTPLATTSKLACSTTNKIIVSPNADGDGLTVVDSDLNKVAATLVAGTCRGIAAYSVADLLLPCDVKSLAASAGPAAPAADASPALDAEDASPTVDVTVPDDGSAPPAANPLAKGTCLERVLGANGCVKFAALLQCTQLHDVLTQGTKTYTLVAPTDTAMTASSMTASCDASLLDTTLDSLRYYVVPKFQSFAVLSKAKSVSTLKDKMECNQNSLIFSNSADGPTVTGGAFDANVIKADVPACVGPKVNVIVVDRTLTACCVRRSEDIKKLIVSKDPVVLAFMQQFIVQAGASGAGGTLFLPTPPAISAFAAKAAAANYTLTKDVVAQLVSYHLTTSTIRVVTDLAAKPFTEDTSSLSQPDNLASMTICSANDPAFQPRVLVQLSDSTSQSTSATVFPAGKYTVSTITTANITTVRQNCDGVIYVIDNVLVPCPIAGVAGEAALTPSPAAVDPLMPGGSGGLTPGLFGAASPSIRGTTTPGLTPSSLGNGSDLSTLLGSPSSTSAATAVSAQHLLPLLAAAAAAVVAAAL